MGSKLGFKVTLNLMGVALLTIFLVGLLINFALDTQFNRYLRRVEDQQNMIVVQAVEELYAESRSWPLVAASMAYFGMFTDRMIRIEDRSGTTVLDTSTMRRGMMRHRNVPSPGGEGNETPHTTIADVNYREEVIGRAYVTSLLAQQGVYTREDLLFRNTINQSIITAGALGALLALGLSLFLSHRLTSPLRQLTKAAQSIGQGKAPNIVKTKGDDEIARLGQAFNEMAANLVRLENLRKKLTADVSHELRTPLTTIQGYIQGMIDGVIPQDKENMLSIEEEILSLTQLVQDLQDLANAEAPVAKKAPLDLGELLRDVCTRLQPLFQEKGVAIKLDLAKNVLVLGSSSLWRVFYNILTNALTHTDRAGSVKVHLYTQDHQACVKISDTGVGIQPADLPYIFERFYRADPSRTRKTGGSGIGLTIAQELVHAHGGTISAESTVGIGTTFLVTVPFQNLP